jgi:hypothetical protein
MADTQEAPHPATMPRAPDPNSLGEAHDAIMSLLDSPVEAEEDPRAKRASSESEEPTEETLEDPEEETLESEEDLDESEESEEDEDLEESEEEESGDEDIALYTVRVNGEEIEVTEDELVKGYSRQADYTKKTQELSEQRRNIDELTSQYSSQLGQMQNERQQYMDGLNQLIQQSMGGLDQFANVDWNRLKEEDPIEFITKRDEYRETQERVRAGQHQYTIEQQKQAGEMQSLQQEVLKKEHEQMVDKIPEWGDPNQQKTLATGLREYATGQGYTEEEIGSLVDHRSLIVLMKAQKYDALQRADVKTKKVKNKPRVVRSGKGSGKKEAQKSQRIASMKRLQQTGHVSDAASLLEDFVEL